MLSRHSLCHQDVSNFDAIEYELECEAKFVKSENQYRETQIEIDSDIHDESVYRVWDGVLLIGRFSCESKWWRAEPYYKDRTYTRTLKSRIRVFNSNQKAINYIIRSYEN